MASTSNVTPEIEFQPDHIVVLDVGGKLFKTTLSTFSAFPKSRLAKMFCNVETFMHLKAQNDGSFFFDRSPHVFKHVLECYRSKCFCDSPSLNITFRQWHNELVYWQLINESYSPGNHWRLENTNELCPIESLLLLQLREMENGLAAINESIKGDVNRREVHEFINPRKDTFHSPFY